ARASTTPSPYNSLRSASPSHSASQAGGSSGRVGSSWWNRVGGTGQKSRPSTPIAVKKSSAFVAVALSAASTASGSAPKSAPVPDPIALMINAATPTAWGDAIEVPCRYTYTPHVLLLGLPAQSTTASGVLGLKFR